METRQVDMFTIQGSSGCCWASSWSETDLIPGQGTELSTWSPSTPWRSGRLLGRILTRGARDHGDQDTPATWAIPRIWSLFQKLGQRPALTTSQYQVQRPLGTCPPLGDRHPTAIFIAFESPNTPMTCLAPLGSNGLPRPKHLWLWPLVCAASSVSL